MSRKTLMAVLGILGAVFAFFSTQFGLSLDAPIVIGALGIILGYVFFEAKLDFKRIVGQAHKFRDPKFWLALAGILLTSLSETFGWNLPIEIILTIIGFLLSLLFGKDFLKLKQA